jgi:hypothetical protein
MAYCHAAEAPRLVATKTFSFVAARETPGRTSACPKMKLVSDTCALLARRDSGGFCRADRISDECCAGTAAQVFWRPITTGAPKKILLSDSLPFVLWLGDLLAAAAFAVRGTRMGGG